LEEPNPQLSLELGPCHLGDHSGGVRDPRYTRPRDQGEMQMYENNYKTLNLITTALGRNVYDRAAHLETAHDV
jgi:hypothetical protein